MTPAREFPVLRGREEEMFGVPKTVPWALVEPLRESCMRLHDQTLERLAERGGLGPEELHFHVHHGVHGRRWMDVKHDFAAALAWLKEWK